MSYWFEIMNYTSYKFELYFVYHEPRTHYRGNFIIYQRNGRDDKHQFVFSVQ